MKTGVCIKQRIRERETECGERREWGECYIPGKVLNILRNVAKHPGECPQTFQGMPSNILGNVAKHSGECCQTFWECRQAFRRMSSNILGNVVKHSGECPQTFWEMF